jgi:CP family cyanate transporter-like MFS transporter
VVTTPHRTVPDRPPSRTLITVAVLLLAINLRPVVNALGAVIPELRDATGLPAATTGFLLSMPTLAFAVMGLAAPALAARWGSHRSVVVALIALVAGQLMRSVLPGTIALFAGSLIGLAGIAVGNVLLPGLVRLHFPDRIPMMTAAYTTLLTIGGAAAAGLTLPIARGLGGDWRTGLGIRSRARRRRPAGGCRCGRWPAPGSPGRWRCISAPSRWSRTWSSAGWPRSWWTPG